MKKQYLFIKILMMLCSITSYAQFVDSGQDYSIYSEDAEIVDIDNDGDLDIIFGRSFTTGADLEHLWRNDGNGNYTLEVINNSNTNNQTQDIQAIDINDDGLPELFTANLGTSGSNFYNNTNGILTQDSQNFNSYVGIVVADYDDDGDDDMFAIKRGTGTNPDEIIRFRNNNGLLLASATPVITNNRHIVGIQAGHFNNDRFIDLVYITNDINGGNGQDNRVVLNIGDGAGNFTNVWNESVAFVARSLRIARVAPSSFDHILVAVEDPTGINGNGKIQIYEWNGGTQYSFWRSFGNPTDIHRDFALGDLDNDGDLDIFIANNGANNVWYNSGSGIFTQAYSGLGNSNSKAVKLADIDGDGDLDAVVANNSTVNNQPSKIWLNNLINLNNTAPTAVGTIPNISQTQNSTTNQSIDLTQYFADAEDGASGLTYSVTSTDPSYFTTSVSGTDLLINFNTGFGGPDNVTIQATDSQGATVSQSFTITVQNGCDAPTNVSAINIGFNTANITWTGNTSNSSVLAYLWSVMNQGEVPNQGGATPVSSGTVSSPFTNTPTIANLMPNTTYDVYVSTACSFGISNLSSVYSFTTLSCVAPTNVSVSNISFFDADISWTGSANAQDGYQWYVMVQGEVPNQGGATPAASGTVPNGTTTASATGLNFNTDYDVYVEALCSVTSTSPLSNVESFTTLSCQLPTNLSTTNITSTSVTATWTASPTAFNGYNWYLMNPGENPVSSTPIQNGIVTNTSVSVSSLIASTSYDLYIQSRCATGFGSALSTFVSFTTTASCDAPTNLTATNITTSSLDLSWTASPDAANGYRWYILPSGSTDTAQAIETNVTTATFVTGVNASNLTAGTSYDAYVVSRCSATLNSGLSLVETFTIPSPIPLITISGPSNVSENIGTFNLTLTSSQQATQNIEIALSFSGSAIFNTDYTFINNPVAIISTGNLSTTFEIDIIDNNELEALENIIVDIAGVTNGQEDGVQQVETLIEDNETSNISFIDSGQSLATFATDVILGNFNNSSAGLDALISKSNTSDRVFFNSGSGTLSPSNPVQSIGSNGPTNKMAVGDFTGSGNMDVVLAKSGQDEVWLGSNGGIFTAGVDFGNTSNTTALLVQDMDSDGFDDIIIGKSGQIEVYINDYVNNNFMLDFSISQTLSLPNGTIVNDIKLANFNGSGGLDLVAVTNNLNYVFTSNTSGIFSTTPITLPGGSLGSTGVDVYDIDNDGLDDIAISNRVDAVNTGEINQVLLNGSGLNFTVMPLTPRRANISTDVAFVDLDNDGDKDIVFSNSNASNTFWENVNGLFADNGFNITTTNLDSFAIDFGDIDGDGDMDIIYANGGNLTAGPTKIWFNNLQTLSNDEFEITNNLKLYPNPVNNEFSIATKNNAVEKVEVYNLQGRLIKQFNGSSNVYDVQDLKSGLYIINVEYDLGSQTFKIIKQ